ncbi:30S ribosome-binding factor RbfA [Nesterenkonia jeotgali]|uniref:Ribosome-binding factor A n=1 Tax=Nesterenkonia jeotgali TaxID=317018 RepID=A0A0W8IFX1_9MICC|nr:30S ribosome-binding factor RbfA [Nesterenkonia jeotgali]KUG58846.1 ribosome-binding factor A [Nesterenkonia jeotgali]
MADPARAARLAQRIKVIVAEALRRRVKDERAELITVTDARVTNDLQHSTVYYTVMAPDEESRAGAEAVLAANQGTLRYELGRQLNIRLTPTLEFVADEIPESAAHMEDLLRKAREQDEQVAALRKDAQPASEEKPYRWQVEEEPAEDAPAQDAASQDAPAQDGDADASSAADR